MGELGATTYPDPLTVLGLTCGLSDGAGMPEVRLVGFINMDSTSQGHHHLVSGYVFLIHGGATSKPLTRVN